MIQGVFNPIGGGGYGDEGIRRAKRVGWCVEINGASLSGAQKTVSPASNRVDLRPR